MLSGIQILLSFGYEGAGIFGLDLIQGLILDLAGDFFDKIR
jgi:hypothetical protein